MVERQYPADAGARARAGAGPRRHEDHRSARPAIRPTTRSSASRRPTRPPPPAPWWKWSPATKTWSLIVGKNAEGRAIYVRKPKEAASALAEPAVIGRSGPEALDRPPAHRRAGRRRARHRREARERARLSTDAREARRRRPGAEPRAEGPHARRAACRSTGQADALTAFNFDDVRTAAAPPPRGHRSRHLPHFRRPGVRVRRTQGGRQGLRHRDRAAAMPRWRRSSRAAPAAHAAAAADGPRPRKPAARHRPAGRASRGPGRRAPRRARQGTGIRDSALQVRVAVQAAGRPAREEARAGRESREAEPIR